MRSGIRRATPPQSCPSPGHEQAGAAYGRTAGLRAPIRRDGSAAPSAGPRGSAAERVQGGPHPAERTDPGAGVCGGDTAEPARFALITNITPDGAPSLPTLGTYSFHTQLEDQAGQTFRPPLPGGRRQGHPRPPPGISPRQTHRQPAQRPSVSLRRRPHLRRTRHAGRRHQVIGIASGGGALGFPSPGRRGGGSRVIYVRVRSRSPRMHSRSRCRRLGSPSSSRRGRAQVTQSPLSPGGALTAGKLLSQITIAPAYGRSGPAPGPSPVKRTQHAPTWTRAFLAGKRGAASRTYYVHPPRGTPHRHGGCVPMGLHSALFELTSMGDRPQQRSRTSSRGPPALHDQSRGPTSRTPGRPRASSWLHASGALAGT